MKRLQDTPGRYLYHNYAFTAIGGLRHVQRVRRAFNSRFSRPYIDQENPAVILAQLEADRAFFIRELRRHNS